MALHVNKANITKINIVKTKMKIIMQTAPLVEPLPLYRIELI